LSTNVFVRGTTLFVAGTNNADGINIYGNADCCDYGGEGYGGEGIVYVEFFNPGGEGYGGEGCFCPPLFPGTISEPDYVFYGIESICVLAKGGDDVVRVSDLWLEKNLKIEGSGGDDCIQVFGCTSIGGNLDVWGGGGDNHIQVGDANGTTPLPLDAGTYYGFGHVQVGGRTVLMTGAGSDCIQVGGFTAYGDFKVQSGCGDDYVQLQDLWIGGKTLVFTQSGHDLVEIGNPWADDTDLSLESDEWSPIGVYFADIFDLRLGGGNDYLTFYEYVYTEEPLWLGGDGGRYDTLDLTALGISCEEFAYAHMLNGFEYCCDYYSVS
jgi:hypothetical protein